ncbi:MAG: hypothetical protein J3R72DRAFT_134027 [Linnemannia gamsii]|nr:MAG: hypothetical protein J3R72DRAFT_134027 [Linnemannia gamsii]
MTHRKIRSTSPSSNTRPVTSTTSRTTSSINLNDSAVNNSETRLSKSKKNKSSSPTTTTSLSTEATTTTPKHKQRPKQKQSQSQRHSPSPLHTPSSRRYKRQELSHRPSQQTLLDNDSTHINDDDDSHNSPSTMPKPSTYGNTHNNWISEVRLDNTYSTPPILPPLTIPQGVYMSDTSYSTLSSSPRSQLQQKQEGSTRSRSGSVAPASPSPPPSTSTSTGHPEEGGSPKVIALKQTEVRAWVSSQGQKDHPFFPM